MTEERLRRMHELACQARDWVDKFSIYEPPSVECQGNLVGIVEELLEHIENEKQDRAAEQETDPRQMKEPL